MARGPTAAGVSQLMGFGMTILSAIQQGLRVTQLWNEIYTAGYVGGAGGATIQDMSFVAGKFRAWANANAAFAAAAESGLPGITADLIAPAPWADESAFNPVQPSYQIRYTAQILSEGTTYFVDRSGVWNGSLEGFNPSDVVSFAQSSADVLAAGTGGSPINPGEPPPWLGGTSLPVSPSSIAILQVG